MTLDFAPQRVHPEALQITSVDLERLAKEYELQTVAMAAQHAKSVLGINLILDLNRRGLVSAQEAFRFMVALDTTAEFPPPYDAMWRQWVVPFIENTLNYVTNAARLGSRNIAIEIERTLYVPPVPPNRRGLLWRLLFGEE